MSLAVYDESKVIDLFLTFPPGEWEKLLNVRMVEDDTRWARCSLTIEGQTYAEAHCRRKGTPEIWPTEKKPQIIVRFNLINKQGRFRGLRRLNLEHFDQEIAAPIRDRLGMWIMREAGLDAPRVNHARVFKDGAMLGLYMNIEAIDKEFLEDHFGTADSDGNLWESGWDLKTNEDMPNLTRLQAFNALVASEPLNGDHTNFFAQLDAMVDIDQVLLEMAAETAALTDDNFSNGAENYFIYDHPKRGFMVLPWDLDTIYSAQPAADVFAFWEPAPNKLRQLMNQNPAWRARFVEQLIDIRDRVITRLPAMAKQICDQIAAHVFADSNRTPSYTDFLEECTFWQERPLERIAEIKNQLGR
jgi:spore coat protein CotH